MQTATAVEAGVDDDTVTLVVFTQHIAVDVAVAGVVHRLEVNISQATA